MKFEWDKDKNSRNIEKHELSFELAVEIFNGLVLTIEDKRYHEKRFNTLGEIEGIVILNVTHTDRNGITRIISARKANRKERKTYKEFKRTGAGTAGGNEG